MVLVAVLVGAFILVVGLCALMWWADHRMDVALGEAQDELHSLQ